MRERPASDSLRIGQCATLACLLEVTAPKPGNVHRGADFDDLSFTDLVVSAVAIGPAMEDAVRQPLGKTVLDAVRATGWCVASNTNLGMILLIAPLASVAPGEPLRSGLAEVLSRLTPEDAAHVYQAIRWARPGGLGTVTQMDVSGEAPLNLLEAMASARERDLIARQYSNGFLEIFEYVAPWFMEGQSAGWSLTQSIVHVHVRLMATFPDSLIERKCGAAVAAASQQGASQVLTAGLPGDEDYDRALADLDFWLRSDGHRRNPGTSADMVAAGLFVVLRDGMVTPPWR